MTLSNIIDRSFEIFNIRLQDNFPIDVNNISWAVNEHDFSESVKQF